MLYIANTEGITHLHSNMDRLKPYYGSSTYDSKQNLHSNMDRLKQAADTIATVSTVIYIPIWID